MATRPSNRALTQFEEKFTKRYGAGTIETPTKRKYQVVSTGSLTLDYALGCGGWLVGKIAEIWGAEGAHKTTLEMITAANFQRAFPSKPIMWIDMERAWDSEWAEKHGIDLKMVRRMRPRSSEDVSNMARDAIGSGLFSLVVLDSVGGMVTEEEMEKDADKSAMGTAAQVITRMVKQATVLCDDTQTTLHVINQMRANMSLHGPDSQSAGPHALRHQTMHKVYLRRSGTTGYTVGSGPNAETVGFEVVARVEKNRVAPPRRVATFGVFNQDSAEYGPMGIDRASEAFTMGTRLGIIESPSQGYFLLPGDEKKINGKPKTIERLRSDTEMLDRIRTNMLNRIKDQVADDIPEYTEAAESGEEEFDFAMGSAELADA